MRRPAVSYLYSCTFRFICCSRARWTSLVSFKLADIGEGIKQVKVLSVFVKPGDKVEEFDRICEVQSDKATVDITSKYSGVIQVVHIAVGETAKVGHSLVDIKLNPSEGEPRRSNTSCPNKAGVNNKAEVQLSSSETFVESHRTGAKVLATPAVRGFARKCGIDITQVRGTAIGGRVLKQDIDAHMNKICANDEDVLLPITSGIRRAMVISMSESSTIPSFTACDEVELTPLLKFRDMLKDAMAARDSGSGTKLSLMPLLIKAVSLALLLHQEINAHVSLKCENLIVKKNHNIGFAVDTPKGLVIPVVREVQKKDIMELAQEVKELVVLGRSNEIPPDRMRDGTFTLSNIGSIGATYATPMILPPQVAIGAFGRVQVLPRFGPDGGIIKANIMQLSWTADHRVIDGAALVRFSNSFKHYLENPGHIFADIFEKRN